MNADKHLIKLFLNSLYISALTFGGGFVIVSFMKKKYVDELHWIDENEMLDMTALSQSCPGAIAVNASILIGRKIGGWIGMTLAVLGTIIPPMIIISVISLFYNIFASNNYVELMLSGMQAGVAAVIMDVVCDLGIKVFKGKSILHIGMMCIAFILTYVFKINVLVLIFSAIFIGIISTLLKGGKKA